MDSDIDLIRKLGPLAFASRLKRLSERLMKDVALVYKDLNVDFQPRWFPVLYLLGQKSPMAVTEIARALGLTHPAINQIAAGMSRAGLLVSRKDRRDERRRMLSLSAKGRSVMLTLIPVWKDIEQAASEVLDTAAGNILAALDRFEEALDERDMYNRVIVHVKQRQYNAVEIVNYLPNRRRDFKRLNVEWLEEYFSIEEYDRRMLNDPEGEIINKGGIVLFARLEGRIVGTAALICRDGSTFELAKMAVTKAYRERQVGRRLASAVIEHARRLGARTIFLHTSPKLTAANGLYRSLGFSEAKGAPPPSQYQRRTITMIMKIKP